MRTAIASVRPATVLAVVVAAVVVLGIPLTTDTFQTFQFANVAIFFIVITGLNLLTGFSGQISLGNGAFMAVGGYTTALLVHDVNVPYGLTIPLAGILAGLVGFLFGFPALRLRGLYLALATFALALTVTPVLNNFDTFTHGHAGVGIPVASPPLGLALSNEQWMYFLSWAIAGVLFVPVLLLVRSRTGRAWMAIRESERAAASCGVRVSTYKTLAFGISAFYAGVGGSLAVINTAYTNPDGYGLTLSLSLLIGLILGGLGYVWGPLLGGLLIVWLPYFAEKAAGVHLGPVSFGGKPDIGFGVLLLLVVFFAPNGVAGLVDIGRRRYRAVRQRFEEQPAAPAGERPATEPDKMHT